MIALFSLEGDFQYFRGVMDVRFRGRSFSDMAKKCFHFPDIQIVYIKRILIRKDVLNSMEEFFYMLPELPFDGISVTKTDPTFPGISFLEVVRMDRYGFIRVPEAEIRSVLNIDLEITEGSKIARN